MVGKPEDDSQFAQRVVAVGTPPGNATSSSGSSGSGSSGSGSGTGAQDADVQEEADEAVATGTVPGGTDMVSTMDSESLETANVTRRVRCNDG